MASVLPSLLGLLSRANEVVEEFSGVGGSVVTVSATDTVRLRVCVPCRGRDEFVTHSVSRYLWGISLSPEQAVGLATLLSHGRASPCADSPWFLACF